MARVPTWSAYARRLLITSSLCILSPITITIATNNNTDTITITTIDININININTNTNINTNINITIIMSERVKGALDKLAHEAELLAANSAIVRVNMPTITDAALASMGVELKRIREETIAECEHAIQVEQTFEELTRKLQDLQAKCDDLEKENSELRNRIVAYAMPERVAKAGDKRSRREATADSPALDASLVQRMDPPHLMLSIEDEPIEGTPLESHSIQRITEIMDRNRRRRAISLARSNTVFWTEEDDQDSAHRWAWMKKHTALAGDWGTMGTVNWHEQMKRVLQNKGLADVTLMIDNYMFGDKRMEPLTPRGCFFGKLAKIKCSPGGDDLKRERCEYCRLQKGTKEVKANLRKSHCSGAFAESVALPYPERNEDGSIDLNTEYKAVAPFFNEDEIRWVFTCHD